jgi:hypothetical protein
MSIRVPAYSLRAFPSGMMLLCHLLRRNVTGLAKQPQIKEDQRLKYE